MDVTVALSPDEIQLLVEALDTHEYWALGYDLPRNDGLVFLPGDSLDLPDPYWRSEPSEHQLHDVGAVQTLRDLADRLRRLVPDVA
jgi:hypothetical protein